jgi:hypothetical protein
VTVTASHIDSKTARVTGADTPFELVLGESIDKGWHATAQPGPHAPAGAHAVDLGTSELVDGFANGWQISAKDLAALGGSSFTVEMTWTPQNLVWGALAISGATIAICLVLALLPIRSRRWLRARLPRRLRGPAGPDAPERPSTPFDPPTLTIPFLPSSSPSSSSPSSSDDPDATSRSDRPLPSATGDGVRTSDALSRDRSTLTTLDAIEPGEGASGAGEVELRNTPHSVRRAIVVGLVTGAVAAMVVPLWAALVVAGVVVAGLYVPWVRGLAAAAGVVLVAAGCATVVYGQAVHHYLSGSNWPSAFTRSGNLIWIGVVLLLADAAISAFQLRLPRPLGSRALQSAEPAASSEAAAGGENSVAPESEAAGDDGGD